jgi:hypothetical protein
MNVDVIQRRLWEQAARGSDVSPQWMSAACDPMQQSSMIKKRLESRMQGNLHVRFGVGAGGDPRPTPREERRDPQ